MAKVAWNDMTAFAKVIVEDYKLFEGLDLVPLETYEGMDTRPAWDFKAPMATGFYKPYVLKGSVRVEKITVGELHYMGRAKYCALNMTASNDYDLPIYPCEFDETAPRVGVTMDLMPTVDIARHEEYLQKYYREIAPLWRKYRTIPGFTSEGRWMIWVRCQSSNGVKVIIPATYPSIRLARREGKKAPWQQSWNRIKMRTRKPEAGTANNKVTQKGYHRRSR